MWVLLQISYAFQQCKIFKNRLRCDKVTDILKVGTFSETQCSLVKSKLSYLSRGLLTYSRAVTLVLHHFDNDDDDDLTS